MLKKYYPYEYVESVFVIDYEKLFTLGYRGIVFDIDNTLVHHGDDSNIKVDKLFNTIHSIGFKTLLLSNNSAARIERFNRNIGALYIAEADKPKKAGYVKAVNMLGLEKEKVVVIGDQLFTDILGANRSEMASILVRFMQRETETKIGKKRMLEKVILSIYKTKKAYQNRLGDITKKEGEGIAKEEKTVL